MTVRSGSSPRARDVSADQARPYGEDYDPATPPARTGRDPRKRRSSGGGLRAFLRFLVFALVLAVVVLAALVTVLRPLISSTIVGWAADNPSALSIPFVADIVREDLGAALKTAPTSDPAEVDFVVNDGDTARSIAARLHDQGFLTDPRAFVFTTIDRHLTDQLKAGTFSLRRNMTPDELATTLSSPVKDQTIALQFREGLRLEQIVAKLETLPVTMDVSQFYELVKHPSAAILAAHPWLDLPTGASLEGFLAPATYRVLPTITPAELINQMLDTFYQQVGADRMNVPKARGLSFFQIVTLASLVEHEAVIDPERPIIAGVYQNRLNRKLWPTGLLQADPTVFYGTDTVALDALSIGQWTQFSFWSPPVTALRDVTLPKALEGYQTYQHPGLMPGPICTPTAASIDAALKPDVRAGYLYFVAKHDGSNEHAFARTYAEHLANLKKYGYQ